MLSDAARFWIQKARDDMATAKAKRCGHGPNCQQCAKTKETP